MCQDLLQTLNMYLYHESNAMVFIFQMRNRSTESLSHLPKVTELETGGLIPETRLLTSALY